MALVIRKLLGYRRFEGLAAARAITRGLYGASRLFVNFFTALVQTGCQAARSGAKKLSKRYHPPQDALRATRSRARRVSRWLPRSS